jgi:hypothetical protein
MPRGGKREGAGRKIGVPNQRTVAFRNAIEARAHKGESPLDFLLRVMRDEGLQLSIRLSAANSAAPYLHPRLSSIEYKQALDLSKLTDEELETLRRIMERLDGAGRDGTQAGATTH